MSEAAVRDILARGKKPLFVGGTPLYLKACLRGIFEGPPADPALRQSLEREAADAGVGILHQRLRSVDPDAADKILRGDKRRIIRALEVYEKTGRPISQWQQEFEKPASPCPPVACIVRSREERRKRIDARVTQMMDRGWIEEVRQLMAPGQPPLSRVAIQAVGYEEIIDYLAGNITREAMIDLIKIRTRQFSKRQMTWFRHIEECVFFETSEQESMPSLLDRLLSFLRNIGKTVEVNRLLPTHLPTQNRKLPNLFSVEAFMPSFRLIVSVAAMLLGVTTLQAKENPVSFQKEIAPVLVEKCLGCHNQEKSEGKYSLATYPLLLKGGKKGKSIEIGKPEESLLSRMCRGTEKPSMPFEDDKLEESLLTKIDAWIREGAKFDGPNSELPLEELVASSHPTPINRDSPQPVPVLAIAFLPDGMVLAAGGYYQITFWDITTGKFIGPWPTDVEQIYDLCYTPDGKNLDPCRRNAGETRRGGRMGYRDRKAPPKADRYEGCSLCGRPSPRIAQVAAGGTDRIFRVWEIDTGKELFAVENHADWIFDLAYSADGKKLLTASRDRSAKVWDQTTAEPLLTFAQHTDAVYAVGANPEGTIACSIGADKQLRFWQMEGNGDQKSAIPAHQDTASRLVYAPSGKLVITAGNDHRVIAWNPTDGKAIREFVGHQDAVYSIALSKDEKRLATGSWDGEIRLWNVESGELVTHFLVIPAPVSSPGPGS